MLQAYYPVDKELYQREAGSAALTADAYVGNQFDQGAAVLTSMACVVNLEAIKVSAGDETYTFRVIGSNTADRSDRRTLAEFTVGDAAAKAHDTADDLVGDQHVILFSTQRSGENQRYLDLHLDVAGTAPSITFSAYFSKQMM